jgi:predicted dehydrogenase
MAFKVGLIGLGMAVTPHAKSLNDLKDRVEVGYAFSPSAQRRAKFAEKFAFPQCDRLETLLQDESIDAVLVLTPPNTHLELVERCADAGKHVLLEKPLEISLANSRKLVEAARKKSIKLGVVLQHRFRPAVEKLQSSLKSGALGSLVSASALIPYGARRRATTTSPGAARARATAAGCSSRRASIRSTFFCLSREKSPR